MLAELKFVLGAVNKKTVLPALTHFKIEDGTVRSYNGVLALCSPIPIDLLVVPLAVPFYNAIKLCDEETISMTLTPTKRLSIKSGTFKTLIECLTDTNTPHALPEGDIFVDLNGKVLLETFKILESFIGDDASRPWSNGVLFKDEYAYATNNIIVVQRWIGTQFPAALNVPEMMIREVLRIGEPPITAQIHERSMTLHYANGRWIRCQLLSAQWPDLAKILDVPASLEPVTEGMFKSLKKLAPFKDKFGRVFLRGNEMKTHESDNDGATVEIEGVPKKAIFNLDQLALLDGVATKIDFSAYPKPCIFHGHNLRGAIIGLRL